MLSLAIEGAQMRGLPARVRMVEVGPRDGLQNEAGDPAGRVKIALIDRLCGDAGLPVVEATSFVSAKWVPQMADGAEVLAGIAAQPGRAYPVLVPNLRASRRRGRPARRRWRSSPRPRRASRSATSTAPSPRAWNASSRSWRPRAAGIKVRGYVSCVLGCPYEGDVRPTRWRMSPARWRDGLL